MSEVDVNQPIHESVGFDSFDREAFESDSSSALGLDHNAQLVDERDWITKNNSRLKALCEREGIAYGATDEPQNKGAYVDVERHIDAVRREHPELPEIEVVRIGRARADTAEPVKSFSDLQADYLGASIEAIMQPSGAGQRIHGGSGGGNVTQIRKHRIYVECPKCFGAKGSGGKVCRRCKGAGTVGTRTFEAESVQRIGAKAHGGGSSATGKAKAAQPAARESFYASLVG
jgi:hypothetical protein